MELTNVWKWSTGIAAQDNCTTFHNSFAFLSFASWTSFFMPAHRFSGGLISGDCAGECAPGILFVRNQGFACSLACLGSLSCWNTPCQGISSAAYGFLHYSDVLKLIHDLYYVIIRTPLYEKHPHTMMLAPSCFTAWDPKRTILRSSIHKVFSYFFSGELLCSLANCRRFSASFLNSWILHGVGWL